MDKKKYISYEYRKKEYKVNIDYKYKFIKMASNVEDFLHQIQNMMDQIKPKNNLEKEDPTINHKSKIVDSVEVLSFSILLHMYMGFYLFLISQPFIAMIVYQAFVFGVSYSLFQYNFFYFIFHPFFQNHSKDIVMPQILYTFFHYYILFHNYPFYITIFMNIIMYHLSNSYFENTEHIESKKIRTFMNILVYFMKFFYIKMIQYFF